MAKILDDHRKRWHPLRTVVNAILWLNYTGLQWRELDKRTHTPPWQTVYYHFRQLKLKGIWEQLLDSLVVAERKRQDREATPSLVAIDSQTVKIVQFIDEQTGIDGNKKLNGRKRNIAVDRLGLPWSIAVTSANISDNEAGKLVVDRLLGKVPRLAVVAADHGYKVSFVEYVESECGWRVEIVPQRRTVKTRKWSGLRARKEPLDGRAQLRLAQFSATVISRCGENRRKFAGPPLRKRCFNLPSFPFCSIG